jgi:hypothetical protein
MHDLDLGTWRRPTWHLHAACRGHDVAIFFPGKGQNADPNARALCNRCPVATQCLTRGMGDNGNRPERHGIWGATSERQRRLARRARRLDDELAS